MCPQHTFLHSTGEVVPATGAYTVHHDQHRLPNNVILFGGEPFPRCSKCNVAVKFILEKQVEVEYRPTRMYALPDLDDTEKKANIAGAGE